MAKEEPRKDELATRRTGPLFRQERTLTVGGLERALLKDYPGEDAQEWDRTGLAVGDPAAVVRGVAVALDPTVSAVRDAATAGANVLVTHHPPYLEAPDSFGPIGSSACVPGSVVWEAVSRGVALMCFHTALDAAPSASQVLPGMLGLSVRSVLSPLPTTKRKGIGQVCSVRPSDAPLSLAQLAARCVSVFGRPPRVWGDFSRELAVIAVCSGSAGSVVRECFDVHADCLVCGELHYHTALEASERGLAVIELGHDVSELPYVAPLMASVERAGVRKDCITAIDQSGYWAIPESRRV